MGITLASSRTYCEQSLLPLIVAKAVFQELIVMICMRSLSPSRPRSPNKKPSLKR